MKKMMRFLLTMSVLFATSSFAGDTIYQMNLNTYGNHPHIIKAQAIKFYSGKECSSMSLQYKTRPPESVFPSMSMDSRDIVIYFGPEQGCLRVDFTYKGIPVSTGPVKLKWNKSKGKYEKATPGESTLYFY